MRRIFKPPDSLAGSDVEGVAVVGEVHALNVETGEVEWDVDAFALVGPHLIIWIAI